MEIRQLTFLRFLAAMGIVVFHFGRNTTSLGWLSPLWERANTAVSFFFLLSGFILAHVYSARSIVRPADFYVARLARIGPLYWLALAATVVLGMRQGRPDPIALLLNTMLLQAWWPGYALTINSPGWSLSVEMMFYLSFPWLLLWISKLSSGKLAAIATSVWAANVALHVALKIAADRMHSRVLGELADYHPILHLGTFVIGTAGGLLFDRHLDRFQRIALPLMAGAVALFLIAVLVPNPVMTYHHNGLLAPVFLAFIWGLGAAPNSAIARLFSGTQLALLGEASYGVYILQIPVFLLYASVLRRTGWNLSADLQFWTYAALLVSVSVACFKFIEVPLRERLKAVYAFATRRQAPIPPPA